MVTDINPTGGGFFAFDLTNVNGTLFFDANDGIHGYELWMSDGTSNGTQLVQDIYPGPGDSLPLNLTNLKGTLFFTANDPVHGVELWEFNKKS
jgi:ELWxxDGT repeat protein